MRRLLGALLAALPLVACAGARIHTLPAATRPVPSSTATTLPLPMSAEIVLPRRTLRAGSSMTGRVVVENRTGHAVRETGCLSLFQVALTRPGYHPQIAWATCAQGLTIPAGRSTYRIEVTSSYLACSNGRHTADFPACLPDGGLPPLPVGNYRATLFQSGKLVPDPPPILVRVTA